MTAKPSYPGFGLKVCENPSVDFSRVNLDKSKVQWFCPTVKNAIAQSTGAGDSTFNQFKKKFEQSGRGFLKFQYLKLDDEEKGRRVNSTCVMVIMVWHNTFQKGKTEFQMKNAVRGVLFGLSIWNNVLLWDDQYKGLFKLDEFYDQFPWVFDPISKGDYEVLQGKIKLLDAAPPQSPAWNPDSSANNQPTTAASAARGNQQPPPSQQPSSNQQPRQPSVAFPDGQTIVIRHDQPPQFDERVMQYQNNNDTFVISRGRPQRLPGNGAGVPSGSATVGGLPPPPPYQQNPTASSVAAPSSATVLTSATRPLATVSSDSPVSWSCYEDIPGAFHEVGQSQNATMEDGDTDMYSSMPVRVDRVDSTSLSKRLVLRDE